MEEKEKWRGLFTFEKVFGEATVNEKTILNVPVTHINSSHTTALCRLPENFWSKDKEFHSDIPNGDALAAFTFLKQLYGKDITFRVRLYESHDHPILIGVEGEGESFRVLVAPQITDREPPLGKDVKRLREKVKELQKEVEQRDSTISHLGEVQRVKDKAIGELENKLKNMKTSLKEMSA